MKTLFFRGRLPFFLVILLLILHWPVSFGKSNSIDFKKYENHSLLSSLSMQLYEKLNLDSMGLSSQAYLHAVTGFEKLQNAGKFCGKHLLSIVDFTKPSSQKRLFIIDLQEGKILFNTYVAHGQNSGTLYAEKFSNKLSSFQSSLGFYETKETYIGKHGYSLQLNGLEKGINDKADERAIVVHGAAYVSEGMINMQGYIGRSWGCPAIPEKLSKPIIDKIKDGTCLFIFANDNQYLEHSEVFKS
jgi:L,D-transpeptidase catalytic domain